MLFIGIDLGTSSVKLLLMKSGGEILRTVTEEYPVYFPQSGWSEQDPEEWFNGTVKGVVALSYDLEDLCPGVLVHVRIVVDDP